MHHLRSTHESVESAMYRFHIFRHALQFPVPEIEHTKMVGSNLLSTTDSIMATW